MTNVALSILYSEEEIRTRVEDMARRIKNANAKPDIAVAVLAGAFVFTADLLRALAHEGLSLPLEFLWLRSYADSREGGTVSVLAGPSDSVRKRNVLLIDGVLDHGHTIAKAKSLLAEAGAHSITTALAVDKARANAVSKSDYALFIGPTNFIVGYGMDDAGMHRGLPHIYKID